MNAMQLLDLLSENPRATVMDLADILGESLEEVEKTKKSLEDKKIICGYHTVINWDNTNVDHVDAFIGVSAKPQRGKGYDAIAERLAKFPEVSSLYLVSGTSEFLLSLNARTMREVADFVGDKLAPIEGVTATVTMFVLKKYKVNGVTMNIPEEVLDDRLPVSA